MSIDSTLRAGQSGGTEEFLVGGGEMGRRMRAHDWAATPLGPPARWPRSLKTAVRIMLTSRQPIWIGWGQALTYLYNDAYKSIIGGKHPQALGQPTAMVWREIWTDIGPMLATAMGGDEGTYVEQQQLIMERNGYPEETYYTFSYSPVPDDDGGVGGIICANSDDTQRVISERQLSLLRDLAAGTADSRTWQEACERAARMLETNPRDMPFALIYTAEPGSLDVTCASLCGIDPGHPAAPAVMRAGHAPWPFSEVLRRQETRLVDDIAARFATGFRVGVWPQAPRQAAILPLPAIGDKARAGVLIVGLNPFRLFDDSYRGFLALVAGQIAASIANALAYEQERQRAEALAEVDRAKTTFFSNVSHEFRTPLTLMMTPLEQVLARSEQTLPADVRALLEIAHRNSMRLLKLVNALLDFSRFEAGRVEANYEPVDLAQFTVDLASNFQSVLARAGLAFVVVCPPLPAPVHVDRDMWEKVVLNLLSNAFKFTFEGEIAVVIDASADGSHAELTVRDTGTGIPASELPHLFERFRRVEGARGRSFEGSGIGLALVQELIKLHGGRIGVASEVGRGSTFTVSLPFGTTHLPSDKIGRARAGRSTSVRAQAYVDEALGWLSTESEIDEEAPQTAAAEDLSTSGAISDARDRLVLLADDNADMRQYVQRLLRSAGFRVEAVTDGEAALAAAQRLQPDLVLSDVMMPKLDGFGLLTALRADPVLRDTPVLLLSARAGEEAKVEGLGAGADDYLTKPFSARELLARVDVNLRLARTRKETARVLRDEAQTLEQLNKVGTAIAAEIDLERAVQVVTDAATELSGAAFGAFFYNVIDDKGEAYTLYTLSGAPREAFSRFPMPRNTAVFAPTFHGEGIVRSADITRDPRYGHNAPHAGMPAGHLPLRSYLAVPVVSPSGEVLGGLFFGHPDVGVFDERAERIVASIAPQAAVAIEKARLYRSAQSEIEQRTRSEQALRESEQKLEAKVVERTAELTLANERLRVEAIERERAEDALRQAQKMESIGRLTGGVAHDFNNLLTVIVGNLETVQRQLRGPASNLVALARSSDQAMRGAQRATALTQRLLAFSRQQPLDPKPVDVGRLVVGMSELLRRTIGEEITVESVLAGGLWSVHTDPNQLEAAILNLAVNARDAMPGGGKLTIETANTFLDEAYASAQAEVVPGQYVVIAISDSGVGMTRDTMARAFEPFFTTKEVGHGTGLGLSQVYGFVKQSGGHVKLYSELGQGTTVKIYLPRLHSAESGDEAEAPMSIPGATGDETVLVVEDDNDVRSYTTGLLRELGYTVVEAPDGRTALRCLEQEPMIKLLFTDVGLPGGMNGRQLADHARQRKPHLKVLFTTGYARNAIVHDGRLDPGVQLITKPFSYAAIAAKLRDILDAPTLSRRILVVEDEALIQMLVVENLDELGLGAEAVASATEALNKLRLTQGGFDGVIVDVGLPDRRGDELVAELRVLYPSLPVLIATGSDSQQLRVRFSGDRLIAVLGKPYALEELRSALLAVGVRI
ncbi:response regulator [Reyranella sp. CPCC 100927]|uniref:response regulator n=1 Tax=Reyranella sp. CPCC 100927 TaxID=2599616 RepID=UPI0011B5797F|nr:response regulator [Reyranella sp. CPCC 100927]TWS94441.1 response regulator [Reyranella sp. CPCC 100927]